MRLELGSQGTLERFWKQRLQNKTGISLFLYYLLFATLISKYLCSSIFYGLFFLFINLIITWSDATAVFVESRDSLRFVYIDHSLTLTINLGRTT